MSSIKESQKLLEEELGNEILGILDRNDMEIEKKIKEVKSNEKIAKKITESLYLYVFLL